MIKTAKKEVERIIENLSLKSLRSIEDGVDMKYTYDYITNVPHAVVYHSPSGLSYGYLGSGCSELALNILHHYFPPKSDSLPTLKKGNCTVSMTAGVLYQLFKEEFIAPVPKKGGFIEASKIREWVKIHQNVIKDSFEYKYHTKAQV